jgi:hypothetical protein
MYVIEGGKLKFVRVVPRLSLYAVDSKKTDAWCARQGKVLVHVEYDVLLWKVTGMSASSLNCSGLAVLL